MQCSRSAYKPHNLCLSILMKWDSCLIPLSHSHIYSLPCLLLTFPQQIYSVDVSSERYTVCGVPLLHASCIGLCVSECAAYHPSYGEVVYTYIQVVSFYVYMCLVRWDSTSTFALPSLSSFYSLCSLPLPFPSPPCPLLPPISTAFFSPPPLPTTNSQSTFIFQLQ